MNVKNWFSVALLRSRSEALRWAGACSLFAFVDLLGHGASFATLALATTLVWGFALLTGAIVGASCGLSEHASRWQCAAASLGIGAFCAWYLIDALGVLGRLSGGLRGQALLALGGACAVGLLVAVLIWGYWHVTALRLRSNWRLRVTCGALLLLTAISSSVLDRAIPPDVYPPIHVTLRASAFVAVALAAGCLAPQFDPVRLCWPAAAVGLLPWVLSWSTDTAATMLATPSTSLVLRAARDLSDWDRDGYSSLFAHGDCSPWRPEVAPLARDVPGNGQDENCMRGDLRVPTVSASARSVEPPPPPVAPLTVVLITIDSLRADRMSTYGGTNETTPAISRFAERAVKFERAYTSGGWTSLALPSLFYGVYPRRLQWTRLNETNRGRLLRMADPLRAGEVVQKVFALPLSEKRPMLGTLLRAQGVRTAAVVDDGFSAYLDGSLGAFHGFDDYAEVDQLPKGRRNDLGTTDSAIAALDRVEPHSRFFMWVHYFGPHAPTVWHPEVPRFGSDVAAGYDHEIRFTDLQVGRLLVRLDTLRAQRPVVVIITADHGEDLTQHERHHGLAINPGSTHIPLLIAWPDGTSAEVSQSVASLVDVMPTVLGLFGVRGPSDLDGVDLRDALPNGSDNRVLMAETWRFNRDGERVVDQLAAISNRGRAVFDLLDQGWVGSGSDFARERDEMGKYLEQVSGPVLAN